MDEYATEMAWMEYSIKEEKTKTQIFHESLLEKRERRR